VRPARRRTNRMTATATPAITITVAPLKGGSVKEHVTAGDCLGKIDLGDAIPAGCGVLRIPTEESGDERYTWDRRFADQTREAKRVFDELVAKGMVPYRVDSRGQRTPKVMRKFDPHAEEIVFAPIHRVAGG
jgi:hypothetical protein